MSKLKLSNSQRDLYVQCSKKYYYRYVRKMRSKHKGSALFFGGAFDHACEVLLADRNLPAAKVAFTERWMNQEQNFNCKFAKADYVDKILTAEDVAKLTSCTDNLNFSKPMEGYAQHQDVLKLVQDIKKMGENSFVRDLTREETQFLHFANVLSMNRKGLLMLESFYENILPHISKVVGTQVAVDMKHPDGHSIGGFIDLLCNMDGYKLPSGRILLPNDLVVADVKSAGAAYWAKLDDLNNSDQLDTYLISEAVQSIAPTNLVAYFAVSKQISTIEKSFCKSCGNVKLSAHKTCNAEVNKVRCNGNWDMQQTYYVDAKIVIGERNLDDASLMIEDYEGTLNGVLNQVFIRNRSACDAYGQTCEYANVCGKACSKQEEDQRVQEWILKNGE